MATDFELKDTPSLTLEPDLESVADLVAAAPAAALTTE